MTAVAASGFTFVSWWQWCYVRGRAGRPARPRTQHDCHHNTKIKPEAATAVFELLMMGGKTPETCWAVNKRQDNKLENCCIWLVIYLNYIINLQLCCKWLYLDTVTFMSKSSGGFISLSFTVCANSVALSPRNPAIIGHFLDEIWPITDRTVRLLQNLYPMCLEPKAIWKYLPQIFARDSLSTCVSQRLGQPALGG